MPMADVTAYVSHRQDAPTLPAEKWAPIIIDDSRISNLVPQQHEARARHYFKGKRARGAITAVPCR